MSHWSENLKYKREEVMLSGKKVSRKKEHREKRL
jgi:hypothetical protein